MTDPRIFDEYAPDYDDTVARAIAASGESVSYFAELKVSLTAQRFAGHSVASVLDFGCGIGNTTRGLASAFPGARVTGLDPSLQSVIAARDLTTSDGRITYVHHENVRLPFADGSFDLVFLSCVLHHIEPADRAAWVAELHRVCAPAGHVIVFEHNPLNPLTRKVVRDCPFDEGVVLLTPWYTRTLLRTAGLRPDAAHYYFFFPRALKGLRPFERALRKVPVGAQYYVVGAR